MLTNEQRTFFDTNGYLKVESVLDKDVLGDIQMEARRLADDAAPGAGRVWHERALFRRPAFRRILDANLLIDVAEDLLGPDMQLLALDLLLGRTGQGGIGWHRDVAFVCSKTLSINTGLYLQDMTDEVGPLRVVPGSHRWDTLPSEPGPEHGVAEPEHVAEVAARAGDAVFFDAGLWHAGGLNRSGQDRLGLFAYFGRYWIKRMDNYFTQPLPAALQQSPDARTRQLLGMGLRPGIASYHGDDESYNRRGEPGIDFVEDK